MVKRTETDDYGVDEDVFQAFACVPTHVRRHEDVWQLFTPTGQLALRQVRVSAEAMAFAFYLSERLALTGCQHAAPRMIRTCYNDPYVRDGQTFYYLTVWPDGVPFDATDQTQLEEVIQSVAAWHRVAKLESDADTAAPGSSAVWIDAAVSLLKDHGTELASLKRLLEEVDWWQADEEAGAAGWVCHGRLVPWNIRVFANGCKILHYESAFPGHPLFDLAYLLSDVMPLYDWNAALFSRLVSTYEQCLPELTCNRTQLAALLQVPFRAIELAAADQVMGTNAGDKPVVRDLKPSDAMVRALKALTQESTVNEGSNTTVEIDIERETENAAKEQIQHADMTARDQVMAVQPASSKRGGKPAPIRIRHYRPKPERVEKHDDLPPGLNLFPTHRQD